MADRKFFTNIKDAVPLPDLIETQKVSYDWFFKEGMKELFEEISPIKDYIGRDLELYLEDYYLDEGKFDEMAAKSRNATYEAPLRVTAKLVNKRTGEVQEQEIYLGDFPIMTDRIRQRYVGQSLADQVKKMTLQFEWYPVINKYYDVLTWELYS